MMQLIENSKWCPSPCGGPMHFSETGPITFDDFILHGNRTCSVTIPTCNQTTASMEYDLNIQVVGHSCIAWGCCIRAIEAERVILRADFFDRCQCLIATAKANVSCEISSKFRDVKALFDIPCDACSVKLALEFSGTITACTFCAPFAYIQD